MDNSSVVAFPSGSEMGQHLRRKYVQSNFGETIVGLLGTKLYTVFYVGCRLLVLKYLSLEIFLLYVVLFVHCCF